MKNEVTDRDMGFDDLMKAFDDLEGEISVEVGVPEDSGQYEDGANQVLVASANEFGTDTIPERSYLRSTMDEKRALHTTVVVASW